MNLALEEGILEAAPKIRLKNEQGTVRTRTVTQEEYGAILKHMGREQARYHIALWETAMRLKEPTKVTWSKIDFKAGLLRLNAEDVKENTARRTPISYELMQVLLELKEEQKKIPNVGGFVFTRENGKPIKSIREAWLLALEKAKLDDIVPHDFRRSAITRWTALGIPRDIVMAASGHAPSGVHDGYINFSDEQLVEAFREKGLMLPSAQRAKAQKARAAL